MDRWFSAVNLVSEIKSGTPINILQSRARMMRIDPFIGFTFGRNIKSDDDDDPDRIASFNRISWIARPFVEAELTYSEFRDRIVRPQLTISYTRRWPLLPEYFYAKDGSNKTVIGGTSTKVRDYVKLRIDLDIGGAIRPFVSYEFGRNPPKYDLINSNFKTGFSIKFKGK